MPDTPDTPERAAPRPIRKAPIARTAELLSSRIGIVLISFGLLYVSFSWSRDFWAPEEDDLAAVTHEMGRDGEWIVPTLAGRPYYEKPPLLYWSGLLLERGLRFPPRFAYRLAVALFGVFGLWVTYLAGIKFFNRSIALGAVAIQGASALYFRCSSWYLTDVLFSSCVSFSLTCFGVAVLWDRERPLWKVLGFAGLAGACLAKSPLLAPCIVGGALLVFLVLHRRSLWFLHDLRALPTRTGLIVFGAILLPWYVWMTVTHGGGFLQEAFVEQHFGRLVAAESHRRSLWHYFTTLPVDFAPASLFLPLVVLSGHAQFRKVSKKFFVCWTLVVFIGLSFVSSKQGKYLLPIWTPLALLVSAGLLETEVDSMWERWLGIGVLRGVPWILKGVAALLVVALAITIAGLVPGLLGALGVDAVENEPVRSLLSRGAFPIKAAFLMALLAGVLLVAAGRVARAVADDDLLRAIGWFSGSAAGFALAFTLLAPDLNAIKSARPFCEEVRSIVGTRPVAIYGRPRGSIVYYLDRRDLRVFEQVDPSGKTPESERPLESYLRQNQTVYLMAIDRDLERLQGYYGKFRTLVEEVTAGMVGSRRRYVLLRNTPAGDG